MTNRDSSSCQELSVNRPCDKDLELKIAMLLLVYCYLETYR